MARHAASGGRRPLIAALVLCLLIAGVVLLVTRNSPPPKVASPPHPKTHVTTTVKESTTTTTPTPTTTLPVAAAEFEAGHVTAVGDSVMLDYQDPLQTDVPGIAVEAAVSRQWSAGEALLTQLKAQGQLGAEVVVALGTNGPITDTDFDNMMNILQGASRIVFVNIHVDRPWQDSNNQVLTNGAARYKNVYIADWLTLANQNPGWFGSDGTHLAINGPGADAMAQLIATTLSSPLSGG
jgi:hypothetical protein